MGRHELDPVRRLTAAVTLATAGYRFSPGGRTVRLWRVRDGALLSVLADHADDVWSVAFSPDGQWLATASEEGAVNLYRLRPGPAPAPPRVPPP